MTLRPEQVKAKEYLEQQGGRRSAVQIQERVADHLNQAKKVLKALRGT
jgi:hypothetical protein